MHTQAFNCVENGRDSSITARDVNGSLPIDVRGTPSSTTAPLLIDVKEAARLCGIDRATVYKLRSAGRYPRPVKLGRATRWHRQELLSWIDAGCPPMLKWEEHRRQVQKNGKRG